MKNVTIYTDGGVCLANPVNANSLAPCGATGTDGQLYHSADALWYNHRKAVIIPVQKARFPAPCGAAGTDGWLYHSDDILWYNKFY